MPKIVTPVQIIKLSTEQDFENFHRCALQHYDNICSDWSQDVIAAFYKERGLVFATELDLHISLTYKIRDIIAKAFRDYADKAIRDYVQQLIQLFHLTKKPVHHTVKNAVKDVFIHTIDVLVLPKVAGLLSVIVIADPEKYKETTEKMTEKISEDLKDPEPKPKSDPTQKADTRNANKQRDAKKREREEFERKQAEAFAEKARQDARKKQLKAQKKQISK